MPTARDYQHRLDGGEDLVSPAGAAAFGRGIPALVQMRRATAAVWTTINPVLAAGELGVVLDGAAGSRMKVGDGTTAWNALAFI